MSELEAIGGTTLQPHSPSASLEFAAASIRAGSRTVPGPILRESRQISMAFPPISFSRILSLGPLPFSNYRTMRRTTCRPLALEPTTASRFDDSDGSNTRVDKLESLTAPVTTGAKSNVSTSKNRQLRACKASPVLRHDHRCRRAFSCTLSGTWLELCRQLLLRRTPSQ